MTGINREFTPLEGEDSVHLQQVPEADATGDAWSIAVPPDEVDILLQMVDSLPSLTGWPLAAVLATAFGVFALCALLLWRVARSNFEIASLITEANGKASLSRVQALIFTLVVAGSFFATILNTGALPTNIPTAVLFIMGGSLGTYLLSKGIQVGVGGNGDGAYVRPGQPADARTTGPVVRFSTQDPFQVNPGGGAADKGEFRSTVSVSAEMAGSPTLVAVAVGDTKLRISAAFTASQIAHAKVHFFDSAGHPQQVDLAGVTDIETQPDAVTEVRVSFQANAKGQVTVPVTVQQLA